MKCYKNPDMGLLFIRLALATIFIAQGVHKFQNIDVTIGFFGQIGLAPFFAWVVAAVELLGGLAMLAGMFTIWAGGALVITMIVAVFMVTLSKGFFGGYDFNLILLAASLGIAISGPGRYRLPVGGKCEPLN